MATELLVLAFAALLQVAQLGLLSILANRELGSKVALGPRDHVPPLSPRTGRAFRAVDNHFQALILFTIAVVVTVLGGGSGPLTGACAWIYLAARVVYVPAYLFGWTPWRSVVWTIGFLATLCMILAALL